MQWLSEGGGSLISMCRKPFRRPGAAYQKEELGPRVIHDEDAPLQEEDEFEVSNPNRSPASDSSQRQRRSTSVGCIPLPSCMHRRHKDEGQAQFRTEASLDPEMAGNSDLGLGHPHGSAEAVQASPSPSPRGRDELLEEPDASPHHSLRAEMACYEMPTILEEHSIDLDSNDQYSHRSHRSSSSSSPRRRSSSEHGESPLPQFLREQRGSPAPSAQESPTSESPKQAALTKPHGNAAGAAAAAVAAAAVAGPLVSGGPDVPAVGREPHIIERAAAKAAALTRSTSISFDRLAPIVAMPRSLRAHSSPSPLASASLESFLDPAVAKTEAQVRVAFSPTGAARLCAKSVGSLLAAGRSRLDELRGIETDRDGTTGFSQGYLLVDFYRGQAANPNGRTIEQMWTFDFTRVEDEEENTAMQWMFPLQTATTRHDEPEWMRASTPVLSKKAIETFCTDESIQANLRRSFERILSVYGANLVKDNSNKLVVEKTALFLQLAPNWLKFNSAHYDRITRILRCLRICGLISCSVAFCNFLEDVHYSGQYRSVLWSTNIGIWRDAAGVD